MNADLGTAGAWRNSARSPGRLRDQDIDGDGAS
jgi:hypothetical protein